MLDVQATKFVRRLLTQKGRGIIIAAPLLCLLSRLTLAFFAAAAR
jgi:hypothetical protein